MDDRFMNELRREPPPGFARELHERLRRQGPAVAPARAWRPLQWAVPLAGGLAVALVVLSFTFPAVRASAQAFLDLFRVRNFAAVSVDPARFERLKDQKLDFESLFTDRVETPAQHTAPRVVASLQEASSLAGFAVRLPGEPPAGFVPDTIAVVEGASMSFRVHTAALREVLEKLDIRDLQVPEGLDGRTVTASTSPAVTQRFVRERERIEFVQARSPEVSLPAGLELERFGEIGLRIAGLEPDEARRFARSIDWHGTLVVPVSLNASSFTEASVRGGRGLLVSFKEGAAAGPNRHHHEGTLLLWSEGDMVYALTANLPGLVLVQMAESIR
jgi:hypothetical protein